MKKNDFISLRAERIYNAINNSFEFPGKAETLDVLSHIKDPLSLLEAITKLRSNNAIIGLICDDLRDLDQAVLHMEFDPEKTAKAETAKAETAKAETAKDGLEATVAIIDEPAAAKGSDPLDFDFMDDPKPAAEPAAKAEPAKTEPAAKAEPAKAPETDGTALKAVTVDDIRALAIKAAKAGKMAAVTTYLKAAGVPKVQDLDPSKFADFMTAMYKAGV